MLLWSGDGLTSGLLGGAAVATAAGAGIYAIAGHEVEERLLAETSATPLLMALGLTVALNGVSFGPWLILIGAEIMAFGVALLIRDRRAKP
jgi:hypothetical protein